MIKLLQFEWRKLWRQKKSLHLLWFWLVNYFANHFVFENLRNLGTCVQYDIHDFE